MHPVGSPGWQQNSWQNGAQQSAPGWQQQNNWQQSGWQNNQQPGGWQSAPQQGYQGGWQSAPQQSAYSSPMIPTALLYLAFGVVLMVMAGIEGDMGSSVEYYYRSFQALLMDGRGMAILYLPLFIPNPMIIGLACAVYGVLMLVAWVKMIRLQSGGNTLFLVLAILPTVFFAVNLLIAYTQLSNYVPGQYLMEYMAIPLVSLGLCVLVYILQVVYFRKRAYLFVNH